MATTQLRIERMAYGPEGIAHDEAGKTVFVAGGVVPGDVVEAEIAAEQKSFAKANLTKVLEPSPNRAQPACSPAELLCGCPWAALSRELQLKEKRDNVVSSLMRIGKFNAARAEELVAPCERPGDDWGYRNKLELGFSRQGRRVSLGLHAEGSKNLIRLDDSALFDYRGKKFVKSLTGALSYLSSSNDLSFERIGVRSSRRTKDLEIALWTDTGGFPRTQVAKVLGDAVKATSIVRVLSKGPAKARRVVGVERLAGKGHWEERIGEETMLLSAPSFFQVNTRGAERLVELVMEGLNPSEDDEAMDLYCGAGTFTLPLARRAGFVSAVESYGPAVRDLRRNLQQSGLEGYVDAIGGDASREFPDTDADIIVVDPPRAGLAEDVVSQLSQQPARAIAYVSCDPATLARDLARFENEGRFQVQRVTPVDLFPQTFHVENVVVLTRS